MKTAADIAALLERLARLLQNEAHAEGLKPTQWEALRYLARANRFSRSPSAVTAYLGMTKGTVSQTLNALERKGLIAKTSEASDRRNVRIELTKAGHALLARDPVQAMTEAAAALTAAEQRSLAAGLQALLERALAARGGHPFGLCRTCRYFQRRVKDGTPHRCALLEVPLTAEDSDQICVEHEAA